MTKYYAFYAFESMYGGLHEICDIDVLPCDDDATAKNILTNMALQVYHTYCEDEYPYEEFEADGEYFYIGQNLTHNQVKKAKKLAHNNFQELRELCESKQAPWQ